ncbi:MAG TPA: AIM24 family protein [Gaiellaceae bacterium]
MRHTIEGTTMPVLKLDLDPGDKIVAESGELSWLSAGIDLSSGLGGGASAGGLMNAMKRKVAGGSLFMTEYTAREPGELAFAARVPGHIVQVDVDGSHEYRIHRHGFLCATGGVSLELAFQQKFSSGLFGGDGFRLQKLVGEGLAFVELSGELIERELQAGEVLRVHPGHVGMFEPAVSFEITTVPGIANKLFGSDGLFLAKLTGPGRIWLQTMPLPVLASALAPYLAASGGTAAGEGALAGVGAAKLIGGLLRGE